jgi:hypothetical protein
MEAPPEQNEGGKFYDEIERIRNTTGQGVSAYRNALTQVPTQAEYAPNAMTRIAAGLSGLSAGMKDAGKGVAVAQAVNSSKYRQAMSEYSDRLGTLQEQANMERDDMKTRLEGLYKAKELGLKYDEYLAKRDETMNANAARTVTANAAMVGAQARAAEAAKTNYDYQPVQGGFLAVNRNNPLDRQMVPAKTIQDAQLAVSQRTAATGEKNANTNVAQLGVSQQNANTAASNMIINENANSRENALAPRRVAAQELTAGTVRAPEQDAAFDLAQKQMMNEKDYSKFFGTNWRGQPLGPRDFDPGEWERFQTELQERTSDILRSPRRP